jgi:hypothetical protein
MWPSITRPVACLIFTVGITYKILSHARDQRFPTYKLRICQIGAKIPRQNHFRIHTLIFLGQRPSLVCFCSLRNHTRVVLLLYVTNSAKCWKPYYNCHFWFRCIWSWSKKGKEYDFIVFLDFSKTFAILFIFNGGSHYANPNCICLGMAPTKSGAMQQRIIFGDHPSQIRLFIWFAALYRLKNLWFDNPWDFVMYHGNEFWCSFATSLHSQNVEMRLVPCFSGASVTEYVLQIDICIFRGWKQSGALEQKLQRKCI